MKEHWTAIVPVAGKGSRLGFEGPKVLFPILGRPMASWLLGLLSPYCTTIVWVTSPKHSRAICEAIERERPDVDSAYATQPRPLGMADAIQCARHLVKTEYSLVVWGDQVGLDPETIRSTQEQLVAHDAALAIPTVQKESPYIHFIRNEAGRIASVQQAREDEIAISQGKLGESDLGLFGARTQDLFDVLVRAKLLGLGTGKKTGEFNFLPLIPNFEACRGGIVTVQGACLEESLGVNTAQDALAMETWISKRALKAAGGGTNA